MSALSQARTIAGSRAFTGLGARQVQRVANGSMCTMKRKDSYMIEVNVGEDEPEDIAVRKFMNKVVDSRVIEQLRARRYKESPLEEFKRRTRERIERIKAKEILATYEEVYGQDPEVKPFAEFFPDGSLEAMTGQFMDSSMVANYNQDEFLSNGVNGQYMTDAGGGNTAVWGNYNNNPPAQGFQGGYMTPANQQGGFQQGAGMNDYTWSAPGPGAAAEAPAVEQQSPPPLNNSWYAQPMEKLSPNLTPEQKYEQEMIIYNQQMAAYNAAQLQQQQ
eukprot:CAMPEP_0119108044 /NCGR_PEP_ID=MMETSP1180-20130426/13229_1 /TAXON_ID=3052 ORGANISM="Chlamydomonas cf sp, Strain CCMP681" /NCGR_SAMPLE_ID=MMETSP1180 /ASSEMBLY_ACC=CAM_ASM_000741 /LENGTH=274 /DNA_ID=CAMNT_0007093617 /DNA_START=10 /DNA_END=834 /DNA_ORIENTATION=+